ncbi:hypothetical protein JZU56_06440, partial [bacterium]|nr:hypothetical protein [bacterium]
MDNDPKGNDPTDRDPTNEEIVAYLRNGCRHFCPVLLKHVGTTWSFEFRTDFEDTSYQFEGKFVDRTVFEVLCTTETFGKYPRPDALKSLLHD